MADIDRELDWDDEISQEGSEFIILPDGDYKFTVKAFTRGYFEAKASSKIPSCKKAIVDIEVLSPQGNITIKHNLFLYTSCERLLSAFFVSIGLKKYGEPLRMQWNQTVGRTGKLQLTTRTWKSDRDGREYKSNEITKFYEPNESSQPPVVTPSFTPGAF